MKLTNISEKIRKIASISVAPESSILNHITEFFNSNGSSVSPHESSKNTEYKYIKSHDGESFKFTLTNPDPSSDALMSELVTSLNGFGFQTVLVNKKGIIVRSPSKVDDYFTDVVGMLGATATNDGYISLNGCAYKYDMDHRGGLTVFNNKGPISTRCDYQLDSISSKRITDVLRYQDLRYRSIFDESSYATEWLVASPIKLKKHAIYYIGEGNNVVVDPNDESWLLNSLGEHPLTQFDGRRNLDLSRTFRSVASASRGSCSKGKIHKAFAHLLKKRGMIFDT